MSDTLENAQVTTKVCMYCDVEESEDNQFTYCHLCQDYYCDDCSFIHIAAYESK